ncbi:hypothetical protein ACOSP7_022485 [Xanthoceras sorbifolium]
MSPPPPSRWGATQLYTLRLFLVAAPYFPHSLENEVLASSRKKKWFDADNQRSDNSSSDDAGEGRPGLREAVDGKREQRLENRRVERETLSKLRRCCPRRRRRKPRSGDGGSRCKEGKTLFKDGKGSCICVKFSDSKAQSPQTAPSSQQPALPSQSSSHASFIITVEELLRSCKERDSQVVSGGSSIFPILTEECRLGCSAEQELAV